MSYSHGSQIRIKVTNKGLALILVATLMLIKWYDNKMVKSPFNCAIFPLTQPQVANQKKKSGNFALG